jgi:hypothetical protein
VTPDGVRPSADARQTQHGAATVARIVHTLQQALRDEPLQHAGQRAWVQVHGGRQVSRGDPGEEPDDAQHEPLRTRDANLGGHALGSPLEAVDDGPEQLHELEDVGQTVANVSARCVPRCRHGVLRLRFPSIVHDSRFALKRRGQIGPKRHARGGDRRLVVVGRRRSR